MQRGDMKEYVLYFAGYEGTSLSTMLGKGQKCRPGGTARLRQRTRSSTMEVRTRTSSGAWWLMMRAAVSWQMSSRCPLSTISMWTSAACACMPWDSPF